MELNSARSTLSMAWSIGEGIINRRIWLKVRYWERNRANGVYVNARRVDQKWLITQVDHY
jgi:hypothetical protein